MALFVLIGDVVLSGLEVPEELPGLGGIQTTVRHPFPGGDITIQALGAFPHNPIAFSGIMTGPDAFLRAAQLYRLMAVALPTVLVWGPWAWGGMLTKFEGRAKQQFFVPYSVEFETDRDLSGIAAIANALTSLENMLGDQLSGLSGLIGQG